MAFGAEEYEKLKRFQKNKSGATSVPSFFVFLDKFSYAQTLN